MDHTKKRDSNRFAVLDEQPPERSVTKIEDDMVSKYYGNSKTFEQYGKLQLDKQRIRRLNG